jgi:PAS domain-containing protein
MDEQRHGEEELRGQFGAEVDKQMDYIELEIKRRMPHITPTEAVAFNEEQAEAAKYLGVKVRRATEEEQREALEAAMERRALEAAEQCSRKCDGDQIVGIHRENNTNAGQGAVDEWKRAEAEHWEAMRKMQKLYESDFENDPKLSFPGGVAVYAAPFESSPGESSDRVAITDTTGTVPVYQSKDELMGRLAMVLGMPLEELEERVEGRRRQQDPRQQDLFDPGVETTPHPEAPDHVNRTIRKTNLPGGFLMNTREFEKWVLESFVPMQDLMANVEERMDLLLERCKQLEKDNALLRSRIGRNEQVIRELKKGK